MTVDENETKFLNSNDDHENKEEKEKHHKTTAEHLHDFWESSSLQGLPRVFTNSIKFWKLFWLVLFFLLMIGCIYQMYEIFTKYYKYETTTSMNLGYGPMPLPAITICNANHLKHSEVLNHTTGFLGAAYKKIASTNTTADNLDSNENIGQLHQVRNLIDHFVDTVDIDTRIKMGHDVKTMIPWCQMSDYVCTPSINTTLSLSPQYGNCYTFNSHHEPNRRAPLMINQGGMKNGGIELWLFAEGRERMMRYDLSHGFRLDIHPYGTKNLVENKAIAIATGFETFINVRMSHIERMEPPYGECSEEYASSYEELYNYTYDVKTCNASCIDYQIAEHCGCMQQKNYEFYTKSQQETLKPCFQYSESFMFKRRPKLGGAVHTCPLRVRNEVLSMNGTMRCPCPLPCHETKYKFEISQSWFGDDTMYDHFVKTLCFNSGEDNPNCQWLKELPKSEWSDVIRRNFAKVKIYYEDMLYDVSVEQPTYDQAQFMADFGGNVGLWIGASIFTILEIIELFTKIIFSKVTRTNREHHQKVALKKELKKEGKGKALEDEENQTNV